MTIVDTCIHVSVWELPTGRPERTIVLPDRSTGSGARLSPDGRYVLVLVPGGGFVRAELASGRVVVVPGSQAEGNVLNVWPDGLFYAIGRQDGTVDEYTARSFGRGPDLGHL